jgi:predicted amidohydrolase
MATVSTSNLKVALAQFDIELGNVPRNLQKATEFISRAAHNEANIVVLPELWATGYDLERSLAHAEMIQLWVVPRLTQLASEHHIYIAGSSLLADPQGRVFNSATLLDGSGKLVGQYNKVHLFGLMEEDRYLHAGDDAHAFSTSWCDVGLAICYDLRFPELFRKYALDNVSLVLVPAEWPTSRIEHWRSLVQARAIENQYFVAACNRVGVSKETSFAGNSMVVDPWGEILVEGDEDERLLLAVIDLQRIKESRARITTFSDRRADVYGDPLATRAEMD